MQQAEIAKKLNISQQTVSRVLRAPHLVKEKTRRRVLDLMRESGYEPNELANRLKGGGLEIIGLSLQHIRHSFFPEIISGVEQAISQRGWQLAIVSEQFGGPRLQAEHLTAMRRLRFGGILCAPFWENIPLYRDLRRIGFPLVFVDQYLANFDCDYVATDNRLGGRIAAEHLLGLGHRRFAIFRADTVSTSMRDRQEGFLRAVSEQGFEVDPRHDLKCGFSVETGKESFARLWRLPASARPTALFCDNDTAAAGALLTALALGVKIPDELSIVGYAGYDWTEYLPVPLTTVAQSGHEIGTAAVKRLFELIADPRRGDEPSHLDLAPTLTARQSSGPAPSSSPNRSPRTPQKRRTANPQEART
jgi:LacI family transcriptional regulator